MYCEVKKVQISESRASRRHLDFFLITAYLLKQNFYYTIFFNMEASWKHLILFPNDIQVFVAPPWSVQMSRASRRESPRSALEALEAVLCEVICI